MFASLGLYWIWSPTGAKLAVIAESTLHTIDLTTGETTGLAMIVADLLSEHHPRGPGHRIGRDSCSRRPRA
jgi:hypothetical protein